MGTIPDEDIKSIPVVIRIVLWLVTAVLGGSVAALICLKIPADALSETIGELVDKVRPGYGPVAAITILPGIVGAATGAVVNPCLKGAYRLLRGL